MPQNYGRIEDGEEAGLATQQVNIREVDGRVKTRSTEGLAKKVGLTMLCAAAVAGALSAVRGGSSTHGAASLLATPSVKFDPLAQSDPLADEVTNLHHSRAPPLPPTPSPPLNHSTMPTTITPNVFHRGPSPPPPR